MISLDNLEFTDSDKQEIQTYYNEYQNPYISEADFMDFYISGNRLRYEKKYFARRAKINSCLMMYKAFSEKRYLDELEELLADICSENTWALPAHIDADILNQEKYKVIDLFAAETGHMMSEISYLLQNDLSCKLKSRIDTEINKRIITPFLNNKYAWETATNNWAAVCASSVGMTFLYKSPERFPAERILSALEYFLSGYGNDGVCVEGVGYWNYGFEYFMYFAVMLREIFPEYNLINNKKVLAIATFCQKMFLFNDTCVSFSDANRNEKINPGLMAILYNEFGEKIKLPYGLEIARYDNCHRFAQYVRSFIYKMPADIYGENEGEEYFKDAQWYINKKKSFSFAAKGGNNGESHNHNDIGSFIIADTSGQLIADIGCGEYTKDYFSDKRYDYLCNSSFGHSVPIVDGKPQKAGKEICCTIAKHIHNGFFIRSENAYENVIFERIFEVNDNSIAIKDKFISNKPVSVTERFISLRKPEAQNGKIYIGALECPYGHISCEIIKDHDGKDLTVWFLDIDDTDIIFNIVKTSGEAL